MYMHVGSPAYIDWEIARAQTQATGRTCAPPPQAIGRSAWYEKYPEDITKEQWRSCACTICTEVEDLLSTWGLLMSVVHSVKNVQKGEVGRAINVRCDHANCRWCLPESDIRSLTLPEQWPARFKNIIARPTLSASLGLRLPSLLCSPCGCGCCHAERIASGIEGIDDSDEVCVHMHDAIGSVPKLVNLN